MYTAVVSKHLSAGSKKGKGYQDVYSQREKIMLLRILVNPKAAVRTRHILILASLRTSSCLVEKRATVVVRLWHRGAITAVLAIEDYSRAGKQELSHTGRHCAAPYKVPAPTFAPNTPSPLLLQP